MSCSISIEQNLCYFSEHISTPIYVECDKKYRSKVCVQEFSNFVSGLDIQSEQSEYNSPVRKTLIWEPWFGLKPQPFCVALSPLVHWHARFLYCCALYNLFFLGFRQGRSRANKVVSINTTIHLHCFGELELGPGPALAHMCWPGTKAEIIAIVEPRSWLTARSVGILPRV